MQSLHLECGLCRQPAAGKMSVGRRKSEIECRSRPERRFDPHTAAMPLDGLLAECESKSVAGVFFSMQALKRPEYAALEGRVNTRTVISHGEFPIQIHAAG